MKMFVKDLKYNKTGITMISLVITNEDLQNFLDSNTGSNVTEVVKNIDDLIVYFKETNRFYNVDTDGNVTGPVEISKVTDEYPGDITKSST